MVRFQIENSKDLCLNLRIFKTKTKEGEDASKCTI